MASIDPRDIQRMLEGSERRVEIWRKMDDKMKAKGELKGFDHSSGFAFHEGQRRMLVLIQEMMG